MAQCASCKADVLWVVTERGKRMPLDTKPDPQGNIVLGQDDLVEHRQVAYVRPPGTYPIMYRSHFVTCPHAPAWRKKAG